ncbi:hypothetical protein DRP05_07975 [Archaeoglobales archaeon]|nr:MAG: hypothetical protein DRP05_07975 [Archaeoglobales archaeon]
MELDVILKALMKEYGVGEKYFDMVRRLAEDMGLREVIKRFERIEKIKAELEKPPLFGNEVARDVLSGIPENEEIEGGFGLFKDGTFVEVLLTDRGVYLRGRFYG